MSFSILHFCYSQLCYAATYYQPDGGFGACGNHLQNTDAVVALGVNNWAAGAHCGRNILVQYQGRSITLSVQDLCPGCQGDNGIDLTEGAMAAIDPNYVNDGHINVVWSFV
ncbi:RlpA-like double-psi beta-barrel-protein domain-containing protein-containing protein [Mycena metata]|uniref:RlpA-like double-psi beta-barrel-protein domain-containing protein-containing protein n=1 Tax=Mycena metata TaxID=1033252 RepID=A0AAD7NEK8_9AGAR|nr:RlpA-like double-psi beta-barrel-protein domain-containing protein-containing protein [Mycena metata]